MFTGASRVENAELEEQQAAVPPLGGPPPAAAARSSAARRSAADRHRSTVTENRGARHRGTGGSRGLLRDQH